MSQQSNPATLREALTAIIADLRRREKRNLNSAHAGLRGFAEAAGYAADQLEKVAALAASGTHSLPPSIPDGSMATASGVPNVGNEYTAGWTNGRLYEAELINEEYLDLGGWELVNKDKFEKHIESLKAVVRLTNEHGPIGAVAMNEEAPQGVQKASPEGEGREADLRQHIANLLMVYRTALRFIKTCHEQKAWPKDLPVTEESSNVIERADAALRHSAAPSGGAVERKVGNRFVIRENQLVKIATGEAIPEWEPLFLFRARDYLALPALLRLREAYVQDGCTEYLLSLMDETIVAFRTFASEHPEWMKQPGVTRGAVFQPDMSKATQESKTGAVTETK